MHTGGKILVIRGGAIGDFILTLPVLSALKNSFPGVRVEVLGYPKVARLALADGLADDVRSIEAPALAAFFARNGTLSAELEYYFSTFNIIISYLYDPDEIFQTNVRRCSSAQFIQGPHRPSESDDLHATDVFLKPLERLAIFEADSTPRLQVPRKATAQNKIAFHPGSGSEKKNWPEANWSDLLKTLSRETACQFLMVGGEADGEKLDRLQTSVPSSRLEIARNLPLVDLAHQLAQCSLFLGHDSGISHLAAALGVKGLVFWGPSKEQIWRPRSERFRLVTAPELYSLKVEDVWETVYREIA